MQTPVHIRTLSDLGPNFRLTPHCPACFQSGEPLNYLRLLNRYGFDVELEAIRRRLRCSLCGYRDCLLYRGWDAGGYSYGDEHADSQG